jgi:hypothetical protein
MWRIRCGGLRGLRCNPVAPKTRQLRKRSPPAHLRIVVVTLSETWLIARPEHRTVVAPD